MNILHVLDRSLPNISGYSVRSGNIMRFQKKLGISVTAITSPGQEGLHPKEEIEGIAYYRTNMPYFLSVKLIKNNPLLKSIVFMACMRSRIEEIVEKNKIDIIHAHSPFLCGLSSLAVGKKHNIPVVYEVRALWEDAAVDQGKTSTGSLRYHLSRYCETKLLKGVNAVVAICRGLKDEIVSRNISENKIYIMPNGVDTAYFIPQSKDPSLLEKYDLSGIATFSFIGSFFAFEGLEILIKAALRLLDRDSRIKVMIVGSGESEVEALNLIKDSKKENCFILTGKVPHSSVKSYYSVADVMVYPRVDHRLTQLVTPLKPLEAMAMGKAIIVSDVGGLKELVDDGKTGVLFKADDIGDLAEKMMNLAGDEARRLELGKNARISVEKERDWSKIAEGYRLIYSKLLENKGCIS